jgi:hypothetical protein
MTTRSPLPIETIECPLCLGAGKLERTEVLDRLGVKDFARVAQLSAEEAFRLLQSKHDREHQSAWARFETELAKRTAEIRDQHKDELRTAQSERDDLTRRVEDCLREVTQLQARNQQLEVEMSKVARIGKREEMDFADEARTWPGIVVSEKLPRNGDFLLAYRDPSGAPAEPRMVIGNVAFRWRDSAHGNKKKIMTLAVEEFLRRFLLHLLPRGFVRIRNFGFLANRRRAELLPVCFWLLQQSDQSAADSNSPAALPIHSLWQCPLCGGTMHVVERLSAAQLLLRSPPQPDRCAA